MAIKSLFAASGERWGRRILIRVIVKTGPSGKNVSLLRSYVEIRQVRK